jgi:hypothetical protein
MDPSTSRCHQRQPFSTACSNSLRAGVDDAVPEHPVKSISWKTNESPRACPQRQSLDAVTRHQDSDPQRQYPISVHSDSLTALSAATAPQRCQRDINIMIHSDVSQRCPQRHPTTTRCVSLQRCPQLQCICAEAPRSCRVDADTSSSTWCRAEAPRSCRTDGPKAPRSCHLSGSGQGIAISLASTRPVAVTRRLLAAAKRVR